MDINIFNKNTIKDSTQMNRNMGFCWDYTAIWHDALLEQVYKYYRGDKIITKKITQMCKNKRCVNPQHLIEVDKEEWEKMNLEANQMWMDFV